MEDIRTYRFEEEPKRRDDDRLPELEAARSDEEVPFDIPRD